MKATFRFFIFVFSFHFLATFIAVILFDSSLRNDINNQTLTVSALTHGLNRVVKCLSFPLGIFADPKAFSYGMSNVPVGLLLSNSTFWAGLLSIVRMFFYGTSNFPQKANTTGKIFTVGLIHQVFWLCMIHFLATYTLHVFEMAELMGSNPHSPVISVARTFRFPITPILFPDSLWQTTETLITDRFWLILPNSLIWAFAAAMIIRLVSVRRNP